MRFWVTILDSDGRVMHFQADATYLMRAADRKCGIKVIAATRVLQDSRRIA